MHLDDETSLISNRISFVRFEIVISLVKILHIRRDTTTCFACIRAIDPLEAIFTRIQQNYSSVGRMQIISPGGKIYVCVCVYMMSLSLRFCTIIRSRSERSCFFEIFEFIAVLLYDVSLIHHV